MVIDVSITSVLMFAVHTFMWVTLSVLTWFFMYFSDDPSPSNTPVKNSICAAIILVLFLLCYGIVEINWIK